MKILICALNNDVVYRLSKFLAHLFKDANYHIVSVIRQIFHRTVFTKLYKDHMITVLKQVHENITYLLKSSDIGSIHSEILVGKIPDTLIWYIKKNDIDLVAVTTETRQGIEQLNRNFKKLILKIEKPVVVYTSHCDPLLDKMLRVALIGDVDRYQDLVEFISKNYEVKIEKLPLDKITNYHISGERLLKYDLVFVDKKPYVENSLYRVIWAPALLT